MKKCEVHVKNQPASWLVGLLTGLTNGLDLWMVCAFMTRRPCEYPACMAVKQQQCAGLAGLRGPSAVNRQKCSGVPQSALGGALHLIHEFIES